MPRGNDINRLLATRVARHCLRTLDYVYGRVESINVSHPISQTSKSFTHVTRVAYFRLFSISFLYISQIIYQFSLHKRSECRADSDMRSTRPNSFCQHAICSTRRIRSGFDTDFCSTGRGARVVQLRKQRRGASLIN